MVPAYLLCGRFWNVQGLQVRRKRLFQLRTVRHDFDVRKNQVGRWKAENVVAYRSGREGASVVCQEGVVRRGSVQELGCCEGVVRNVSAGIIFG